MSNDPGRSNAAKFMKGYATGGMPTRGMPGRMPMPAKKMAPMGMAKPTLPMGRPPTPAMPPQQMAMKKGGEVKRANGGMTAGAGGGLGRLEKVKMAKRADGGGVGSANSGRWEDDGSYAKHPLAPNQLRAMNNGLANGGRAKRADGGVVTPKPVERIPLSAEENKKYQSRPSGSASVQADTY